MAQIVPILALLCWTGVITAARRAAARRLERHHALVEPGEEPCFYPNDKLRIAENTVALLIIVSGFGLFLFPRGDVNPLVHFRWQLAWLAVFVICVAAVILSGRVAYYRSFFYIDDICIEFNLSYGNDPRATVLLMLDDITEIRRDPRHFTIETKNGRVYRIKRRILRILNGWAIIEQRLAELDTSCRRNA